MSWWNNSNVWFLIYFWAPPHFCSRKHLIPRQTGLFKPPLSSCLEPSGACFVSRDCDTALTVCGETRVSLILISFPIWCGRESVGGWLLRGVTRDVRKLPAVGEKYVCMCACVCARGSEKKVVFPGREQRFNWRVCVYCYISVSSHIQETWWNLWAPCDTAEVRHTHIYAQQWHLCTI